MIKNRKRLFRTIQSRAQTGAFLRKPLHWLRVVRIDQMDIVGGNLFHDGIRRFRVGGDDAVNLRGIAEDKHAVSAETLVGGDQNYPAGYLDHGPLYTGFIAEGGSQA